MRLRFDAVVSCVLSPLRVDVSQLACAIDRLPESEPHCPARPIARCRQPALVECESQADAAPRRQCQDRGSARFGMGAAFQDESGRALAPHLAVAIGVEGPHGRGRIILPVRNVAHHAMADTVERVQLRTGAAGQHHVGRAAADHAAASAMASKPETSA